MKVEHFEETEYKKDSVAKDEAWFESSLGFRAKDGVFCMSESDIEEAGFIDRLFPEPTTSLLPRRPPDSGDPDTKGEKKTVQAEANQGKPNEDRSGASSEAFSFRADRRLIRHLLRIMFLGQCISISTLK